MGDKTQIATVAMAAHYATPLMVVIGTTLGMLIADVPAVFVGDKLATKIPMKLVHSIAAGVFALLGIATLLGAGSKTGASKVTSPERPCMHTEDLSNWMHDHVFDVSNEAAERSTRIVMWITAVMMVVEIVAGWWSNSMALLADGWHMSSHAVAIGLSAVAYATARRYASDARFAFGTWKIEILGGFASAIFLVGVAVMMVVGSVERLVSPQPIHYQEAIAVAVLGLGRQHRLCAHPRQGAPS